MELSDYRKKYLKAYKKKNKDLIKQQDAERYARNKDKMKEAARKYYHEHKKERKEYLERNKKSIQKRHKKYKQKHKEAYVGYAATTKANRLNRIPKWQSENEAKLIKSFYEKCPNGMEVDHIIPLQGKSVSGFHVLKNLQYLTPEENRKKGNKFPYYDMEFYKNKGLI